MINCHEATRLLSQALDRNLSWRERFGLRLHLLICAGCTNFRRQMAVLRRACGRFRDGTGGGDER